MDRRRFLGASGLAMGIGGLYTGFADDQTNHSSKSPQNSAQADDTVSAKVDLHAHLQRGGGQQMADRYAELGFDVLVGTDHHDDIGVDGSVEAETVGDYSHLEFPGPILNGVELSASHHVNVIKSDNEMIKQINHPMRYDDTADDINQLADRVGADLVEVTERGEDLQAYPTIADAVEELDATPTITSDAHSPEAVGAGHVIVEVEELSGDNVIRALEEGRYSLGGGMW